MHGTHKWRIMKIVILPKLVKLRRTETFFLHWHQFYFLLFSKLSILFRSVRRSEFSDWSKSFLFVSSLFSCSIFFLLSLFVDPYWCIFVQQGRSNEHNSFIISRFIDFPVKKLKKFIGLLSHWKNEEWKYFIIMHLKVYNIETLKLFHSFINISMIIKNWYWFRMKLKCFNIWTIYEHYISINFI